MRCCVEGSCEELDWGWDAELVGEEEQEVVLALSLLLGWSILNLGRRYFFQVRDFYDLYDFLRSLFD